MVDQDAVEVDADVREACAADGEVGVEVLVGGDGRQEGKGAKGIVGEDGGEVLLFVAVEGVLAGGVGDGGVEGAGGDGDLLFGLEGVAQSVLTEVDVEFEGGVGDDVDATFEQAITDGGDAEFDGAGRDCREGEAAVVVGGRSGGCAGEGYAGFGEGLAGLEIDDAAGEDTGGSGILRVYRRDWAGEGDGCE